MMKFFFSLDWLAVISGMILESVHFCHLPKTEVTKPSGNLTLSLNKILFFHVHSDYFKFCIGKS